MSNKRIIVYGTASEQALVRTIEELKRDNAKLRELATRMAAEMREIDHEFASLQDYDARKEAQP